MVFITHWPDLVALQPRSNYMRTPFISEQSPTSATFAVALFVYMCVLLGVFVSMRTMRSTRIDSCDGFSLEYVLPVRDCLQMAWIYTVRYITQVINLQSFGNFSNKVLVGEPVCCDEASAALVLVTEENSVANSFVVSSARSGACPFPASSNQVHLEFLKKAFKYGTPFWRHRALWYHA